MMAVPSIKYYPEPLVRFMDLLTRTVEMLRVPQDWIMPTDCQSLCLSLAPGDVAISRGYECYHRARSRNRESARVSQLHDART